jgi:hypothetical protein
MLGWKAAGSGGTRFVASGHDKAWPSRGDIPLHSAIPLTRHSSLKFELIKHLLAINLKIHDNSTFKIIMDFRLELF